MCELFGISSREPQNINKELKELFSHSNEHLRHGLIAYPSELYYPIRIKPSGENSLKALSENG